MKSELKAANQQQALGIAILLLVLIISPIIIFLVRYFVICTSKLFIIPFVRNATATIHIFSLTLSTKEQVMSCHQWSECELQEMCCVGDRNWYKRSRKWRIFCILLFHFRWQGMKKHRHVPFVRMLHISRDIQLKKRVSAEKIGPVTIYHSDIVNFTDLFSDSTPFEVSHRTSHLENISL